MVAQIVVAQIVVAQRVVAEIVVAQIGVAQIGVAQIVVAQIVVAQIVVEQIVVAQNVGNRLNYPITPHISSVASTNISTYFMKFISCTHIRHKACFMHPHKTRYTFPLKSNQYICVYNRYTIFRGGGLKSIKNGKFWQRETVCRPRWFGVKCSFPKIAIFNSTYQKHGKSHSPESVFSMVSV